MSATTGDRIKSYRELAKKSQRDLEAMTGISQTTIARIETGNRTVKSYELSAFAAALGCPESSLMEHHPLRERVQFAARTTDAGVPNQEPVKDFLFDLLEMDNYLKRALKTLRPA
jgi:transcriptional regulator with XRE-family HTH domain